MRIVILDGYAVNPGDLSWESLASQGELTVYDRTPAQEAARRIGDAEVIFTNKTPVTAQTIAECSGLRFIGVLATGYNVVDVEAAKKRGVPVSNVPDYSTASVAQLTFALLLALCHHAEEHGRSVRAGDWTRCPDYCYWNYPLVELAGKTLGIVGYGRIGRAVARIGRAFGMEALAAGPRAAHSAGEGVRAVALDELWPRSDVVSLHCPLTEATRGIVRRETLARMKDGAMLVNTSRGQLVVEEDVRDALVSGKLHGYAADVASTEPIGADNPLLTAPRALLTPHIAWAPREARARLIEASAENLRAYLAGAPVHVVNGS